MVPGVVEILVVIAFSIGGGVTVTPVAYYGKYDSPTCTQVAQTFNAISYAKGDVENEGGVTFARCIFGRRMED